MKLAIPALVAAALAAAAVATTDARACGFFDYREVRPVRVKPVPVAANDRIAAADQRLDEEKLAAAGQEVVLAFPAIRGVAVGASPLETHALRVLALAVVRADGVLPGVAGFSGTGPKAHDANLAWAVGTLRAIEGQRDEDPLAIADLSEAMAHSPAFENEAFTTLSDLAARDLVGSPHAYAALARMRAAHGDATGAVDALGRCEHMTRVPAAVCKAPDGRLALGD
ncbi:MAG TPA: hypothetical protein VGG39_17230 [Polyangiaceae bacterium]|jgi:hypothetical protein